MFAYFAIQSKWATRLPQELWRRGGFKSPAVPRRLSGPTAVRVFAVHDLKRRARDFNPSTLRGKVNGQRRCQA